MDPPLPEAPASTAGTPLPAAVVRHEGAPDGGHFDVLLAVRSPAGPDDPACATWRSAVDPAAAAAGEAIELEPIAPHRALYLALDGPRTLDGGRGTVTPVRRGSWRREPDGAIGFLWSDGSATRVVPESINCWRRCAP